MSAASRAAPPFDTGTDVGGLGHHQRHCLLLHVGAHQRAVGVVVLEERDQRRADRHDLLGRHVHQLHFGRRDLRDLGGRTEEHLLFELQTQVLQRCRLRRTAHQDAVVAERAVGIEGRVGLRDGVFLFFVRGEPHDLVGDLAADHLAVRRLDEAEAVDAGVRRERADEADVGTFWRLDRAHAAVVREVARRGLRTRPLTRQTTGTECRQTATVRETRQWVDLIHELRKLRRAEELFDRGDDGTDVDQRLRCDRLDVLGRHALTHDTLHARQTDAQLVLDQLAHRADATVGEVVLIVEAVARLALGQLQHVGAGAQDLGRRQSPANLARDARGRA
jgi:hypothetical protein